MIRTTASHAAPGHMPDPKAGDMQGNREMQPVPQQSPPALPFYEDLPALLGLQSTKPFESSSILPPCSKGGKKPQGSSFLTSHSILGRPQGSSGAGKDATKSDTAPMSPFQAQDHHPEVLKGLTEEGGLLPKTPAHPGETSPSC